MKVDDETRAHFQGSGLGRTSSTWVSMHSVHLRKKSSATNITFYKLINHDVNVYSVLIDIYYVGYIYIYKRYMDIYDTYISIHLLSIPPNPIRVTLVPILAVMG